MPTPDPNRRCTTCRNLRTPSPPVPSAVGRCEWNELPAWLSSAVTFRWDSYRRIERAWTSCATWEPREETE